MAEEAALYRKLDDGSVHCFLCAHHCRIKPGDFGFCGVRQNSGGKLETHVYAKVIAAGSDPVEKKPLYHFLPGSFSYSLSTAGCNFRCGFCQNWQISQIKKKNQEEIPGKNMPPRQAVDNARENNCRSISYTYTEPTIFFEYAYDTACIAQEEGLYNIFVTNGYMSKEAINRISPYLDAANVDLKSFNDDFYKKSCRARLGPVLESIKYLRESGIWIEITTLIVPGQNDSQEELARIAEFIAGVDKNIPWHISRFHPDYKDTDNRPTPAETMENARQIGKKSGLAYIYLGNIDADTDTLCPNCRRRIIRRSFFSAREILIEKGRCPFCGEKIAGLF